MLAFMKEILDKLLHVVLALFPTSPFLPFIQEIASLPYLGYINWVIPIAPVPREYTFKMNKKEKRAALKSVLTSKVVESNLIVLDELKFDSIKTKNMVNVMKNLQADKALVVLNDNDTNVVMSAKNMPEVKTASVSTINVYDVLKYNKLILTKEAVATIEEVYA